MKAKREIDWVASLFIIGVHIASFAAFFTFSWNALLVMLILHWITGGVGITLGYHRLLTHRSFKTVKPIEYLLSIIGCLACQGGPLSWVTAHRLHHAYSDEEGDPHSPLDGFFWAHMNWCLHENRAISTKEGKKRISLDLYQDPLHRILDKGHIVWTLLLATGLYLWGGWSFVVWGIFVRLVLVYHCTWLVNSAAHVWGYRTYATADKSTNLWWVALLTYGEGWHNNHHAFQFSARHGMKWWEIDTTYWMIKFLEYFGLASAVKIPSKYLLDTTYARNQRIQN
ncbi:MAG: fatty acid desaturase [Candidatus Omnitrophica bacterium]|nr:fatty acid desaturase [Candidatus Omnitrophota bacterium]